MISRRTLLAGIAAAPIAAPAIVKAAIEPSAGYALAHALGADIQVNGAMEAAYLGSLANYDEVLADWSKGDALREVRALSPSDIVAECAREYTECERLGLLVPPPSEPHDAALDSMYERD